MTCPRIIVFAKAPEPGSVKTRLGLDPAVAARLHETFVRDTLAMLAGFPDVELSTDMETLAWKDLPVARSVQSAGDLGDKLLSAIRRGLSLGRRPVLILGGDSPTLAADHIAALLRSKVDVALGPTDDGGFYAISCRRPHAAMFEGVEWSTTRTLYQFMAALKRAGLSFDLGPRWFDVDEPADLERLARSPEAIPSVVLAREVLGVEKPRARR